MATELTAAEKLVQAEAALHKLVTGTKTVSVGYGERRLQYSAANIADLRAYIAQLKGEINPCNARRPFGVRF